MAALGVSCEAPIRPWASSNDVILTEAREIVTGSLRNHLIRATAEEVKHVTFTSAVDSVPGGEQNAIKVAKGGEILADLVGGSPWLEEDPPKRHEFVANLLLQASGAYPSAEPLSRALLSVTSSKDVSGKEARSLAKALLKARRDDLALWGAYAELEADSGNVAAARNVLGTTLGSVSSLPTGAREEAPSLFLGFAEMELRLGESGSGGAESYGPEGAGMERNGQDGAQAALHILTCFGEGEAYSPLVKGAVPPSRILKAKKGFRDKLQEIRTRTLRQPLTDADVSTITCAALFEDLSGGGRQAAASIFEDALNLGLPGKRAKSAPYERLVESYVQMLARSPAKPSKQREAILRGLRTFPRNAELLSLLVRGEAHQMLANRLRRYFDSVGGRAPSTVGWLFALACEMGRPGAGARIRSLFERALSAHETSQSVVLWRAYLSFELDGLKNPSGPSIRPDAARRVFFRALHACPWSKTLWLDGFKRLAETGALTGKEVGDLCETMKDKELRVRTDIYEILLQEADQT